MATKKTAPRKTPDTRAKTPKGVAHSTVSGPARDGPGTTSEGADALQRKMDRTGELAAAIPYNSNKPLEYGEAAYLPEEGVHAESADPDVGASTLTEANTSSKVGTQAAPGTTHATGNLDRVRADNTGQMLTTNQGVRVAQNQDSLKAGMRGPALLEDFILREKITHFDHERIPERVVHGLLRNGVGVGAVDVVGGDGEPGSGWG